MPAANTQVSTEQADPLVSRKRVFIIRVRNRINPEMNEIIPLVKTCEETIDPKL